LPTQPNNPTFCPVIAWVDSGGAFKHRRKLWQDVDEFLPVPPLYQNEEINALFSIEIWNVGGESAVNDDDELCMMTSLFSCAQPGIVNDTYEAAEGEQISPLYIDFSLPLTFLDDVPHLA